MDKKILRRAFINSSATALYIVVIGVFMSHAERFFGKEDKTLTPVALLMLLVFSAAVTGFLVFGQPAIWYADGKKGPALQLLWATFATFGLITALAIVGLAFF